MLTFGYGSAFSCRLRALAMITIGAVLVFAENAPALIVRIVGALVLVSGAVSLLYNLFDKSNAVRRSTIGSAVFTLCLGLLLMSFSAEIAKFAIYLIGFALIVVGALQLLAYMGVMAAAGMGLFAPILAGFIVAGGILILFNPFSLKVMGIIAGVFLIIYGINELGNASRVSKAITDNYGPMGEDKGVDEQ